MAEAKNPNGRHLLAAADMVAVVDGDKNEVGAVPKHWSDDQLAEGLTKTNRKPKGAVTTAAEDTRVRDYEAQIARLEAELEAARAGASAGGQGGDNKGGASQS